jgi:hypothetical protein
MDPAALPTTAAAVASLDPGLVVGLVVAIVAALGAPWWVGPALRVAAAAVFGARAAGVKVEPAPEPVSDGGTAADRALPPAQPGTVPPATNAPGDSG